MRIVLPVWRPYAARTATLALLCGAVLLVLTLRHNYNPQERINVTEGGWRVRRASEESVRTALHHAVCGQEIHLGPLIASNAPGLSQLWRAVPVPRGGGSAVRLQWAANPEYCVSSFSPHGATALHLWTCAASTSTLFQIDHTKKKIRFAHAPGTCVTASSQSLAGAPCSEEETPEQTFTFSGDVEEEVNFVDC